ncbi:zinc finger, CCHC-type containing protein [Tanacetum coccineum]
MGYAPVQAPPFAPKSKNPPTPKKDNPTKDAICHQCGEAGHWRRNCPIYLSELMKKKKLSQGARTSGIFTIELHSFSSTSWVYDTGCGTHICITTQGLRGSRKLKPRALSLYVGDGHRTTVNAIGDFHLCLPRYPKETMGYSFYYPPENKIFVARNAEFFENDVIDHEASGRLKDLEIIQEEDTHPSLDTSLDHEEDDQEIDEPQSDLNPIRKSIKIRRPTDRLCLYVDTEEHELGDLGEPANYKAALLDPKSDKWLNAMNVEMQSMKDNEVWELVELPPDAKTVGHKWLFKKKTDMDGALHTYKARLVAKGFTQTPRIDYEETFSPVAALELLGFL